MFVLQSCLQRQKVGGSNYPVQPTAVCIPFVSAFGIKSTLIRVSPSVRCILRVLMLVSLYTDL